MKYIGKLDDGIEFEINYIQCPECKMGGMFDINTMTPLECPQIVGRRIFKCHKCGHQKEIFGLNEEFKDLSDEQLEKIFA